MLLRMRKVISFVVIFLVMVLKVYWKGSNCCYGTVARDDAVVDHDGDGNDDDDKDNEATMIMIGITQNGRDEHQLASAI